ncbi:MAG: hypothetical protein HYW27_03420 [Candidatus Aenigmarchaeota archaeon]|nr:hypothetical protein [Candidatus Aenigmarchaeota archaeon]
MYPAKVTGQTLLAAAFVNDSLRGFVHDLIGVSTKAFPNAPPEYALERGAHFIAGYHKMWHDVGNAYPTIQSERYRGRTPLYTDTFYQRFSEDVTAEDYWYVFREFMERWAHSMGTGDQDNDWFTAQEQFGLLMGRKHQSL